MPTKIIEWVRGAVEYRQSLGVDKLGKVVVVAVDDNGTLADEGTANTPTVETIGRFSANTLSESESEETDRSHEKEYKTDKAYLLSPGSLTFRAPEALGIRNIR